MSYVEGDRLPGGFRAWEQLGVGVRCETWLVWSPERWCAAVLKFPRPDQGPRARQSLAREVAALQGNPHPVLPRLYADGTAADLPYVATEYVDGLALDEELDEHGLLDDVEVALLGAQLLSGLVPVHARGTAHLDVKPENVVLREGRPVLVDFGSAREIGTKQPPGRPVGTKGYAAPEMEACEPISAAMDLYGVGATLMEALADHTGDAAKLIDSFLAPAADRLSLPEALAACAALLPDDLRPWPTWV